MTLIQKLNNSIITNINIVESENKMCYDYNHLELAENCEVISDEYAIGFVEWCVKNELFYSIQYGRIETKGLLEIYKKEKLL